MKNEEKNKEKKKWYQTGEFEDGYQFGDVFRTIKNSIGEKKQEKYKEKAIVQNSGTGAQIPLAAVKDGKLSLDVPAQTFGWKNEAERVAFKAEHPMEYAVTGGVKLDTNILSKNNIQLSIEQQNILKEARKKDQYIKGLQYKIDLNNIKNAEIKRKKGFLLTDDEIESETRLKWLNGVIGIDELKSQIKKQNDIYNAKIKFDKGGEISLSERLLLAENGGENYTEGNTYKTIDFLAQDNPENINARDAAEKARQKQKNNIPLTKEEKADISNYETRRHIQKSILEDRYALGSDTKKNAENINTIAAIILYNDAIYETGINKTFNRMQLYTNTGFTKYFQDTINTAEILLTEDAYRMRLTDKRGSDVIKSIPKNKYEIANAAVGEYFTKNDMIFNKFVQDTTVSLSNNAIPILLGGVSGGTSMVATGLSVFGSSYAEAVEMAPDAEEWRYWLYAGINTSVEIAMEKLLSGDKNFARNTGSEFTDAMFRTLTKGVSNKLLIKGAYYLSNGTGEFLEETIQGLLSPVMQEFILGVDTTSILSRNRNEQLKAMKNALYDGFVGFASACMTTGIFGGENINNLEQQRLIGSYYNRLFNDLNIDAKDVAAYLEEISGGRNTSLYNASEIILNGDISDMAVANMMVNGMQQCKEIQNTVYTKIGERLNQNNKYTVYGLIRQYDALNKSGVKFSQNITDTYNKLINTEEIGREEFNYLVGKLSTTMDAALPRVSLANELTKKISNEIKEDRLSGSFNTLKDSKNINENELIKGLWEDSPNSSKNNVEKSQLESVENVGESWYNDNNIITDGSHLSNGKLKPNVKYKSGEYDYIYETDEFGNIAHVYVEELKHTERKYRKRHKRNTYGKKIGDHAGHLIADRFGGSAELDNLVSQSAFVNLSEYKKLENIWDNAIKNGQKVSLDMQVKYDENSNRPSEFIVEYSVDGRKCKKTIKN